MGKPDAPEAPDYTEIADASEYAADLSFQIAEDQLAWAMEQYEAGLEVTEPVIDELLETMEFTNEIAEADRARYEEQYQALEDELIAEAESYATPERIELEMGRAQAGVAEQTNAAREAAEMSLESYGVNPADVRYASLDIDTRTDAAAAAAAAGQQAALQAEATGDALRSEAINIGKGYPGYIQSAYSTSLSAGTSAASTQNAATTTASNAMTAPSAYVSTGTEALDVWGNTINTGYQNEMDAYNAQMASMSSLGTTLGTIGGLVLMAKEGGEVPDPRRYNYQGGGPLTPSQSPSRGARPDDIPINAQAGEFMMPQDVVHYYGTKKYYGDIEKAREEMAVAQGAVPASPGRQQPNMHQQMAMAHPRPGAGGGQPMRRPTGPMQPGVPAPAPGRGAIPPMPRGAPARGGGALPVGAARGMAGGGEVGPRAPGGYGGGAAYKTYLDRNSMRPPPGGRGGYSPTPAPAPAPAPAPTPAPVAPAPTYNPAYIGGREGAAPIPGMYDPPVQSMQAGGEVDPNYYPVGVDPASGAYIDPRTGQWVIPAQPLPETLPAPASAPVYAPEPVAPVSDTSSYRRAPERATTAGAGGGFFSGLAGGVTSAVQAQQQAQYNEYLRAQQAQREALQQGALQQTATATPAPSVAPAATTGTVPDPRVPITSAGGYVPTTVPSASGAATRPVPAPPVSGRTPMFMAAQGAYGNVDPRAQPRYQPRRPVEAQRAEQRGAPYSVPPPFSSTNYQNPIEAQRAEQRGMPYSAATTGTYGPPGTPRTPRARPAPSGTTRSGEPARTPKARPEASAAGRTVRPGEMRSAGDVTRRNKPVTLKRGQITAEPESGALSAESFARQGQDYMRSKKGKRAKSGAVPAAESAPRSNRLGRAAGKAFGKDSPPKKPRKRLNIAGRARAGIGELFRGEDEED